MHSVETVFSVVAELRPHLAMLMGNMGFRALIGRALHLALDGVPALQSIEVSPDGSLHASPDLPGKLETAEIVEGNIALLAELLGLLVAFIGEDLTMRLVRDVWPDLELDDLNVDTGDEK